MRGSVWLGLCLEVGRQLDGGRARATPDNPDPNQASPSRNEQGRESDKISSR